MKKLLKVVVWLFVLLVIMLCLFSQNRIAEPRPVSALEPVSTFVENTSINQIQKDYINKQLQYIQLEKKQLSEIGVLSIDGDMVDISSLSYKEDELSKVDCLVTWSAQAMLEEMPQGYKAYWKYLKKINTEYVMFKDVYDRFLNGEEGVGREDLESRKVALNGLYDKIEDYFNLKLKGLN
jgi:hypothetical protein